MKKTKKSSELPAKSTGTVKVDREKIDDLVRSSLKAKFGKPCQVLGCLGIRLATPSKKSGYPFLRFLAQAPDHTYHAVFVGGLHSNKPVVSSIEPAVKSTYTVKALLDRLERKAKRAAAKLAKSEKHAIRDTFDAKVTGKPTILDKANAKLVAAAKASKAPKAEAAK